MLLAEVAIWKFPRFYATWSPTPALDRVPAMAKALDCDSQRLFMLTLEQRWGSTTANVIEEIFGTIVSKYEVVWIAEVRDASKHTDPTLTTRYQTALRAMFPR